MAAISRLAPVLFLFWLYWKGLFAWFAGDDFGLLGLGAAITGPGDVLPVLFKPLAQGTIRPFSERIYFIALHSLFGFNALPFRLWTFAVMSANVLLLYSIVFRMSRSRVAAVAAPVLWTANISLVQVMTWNAIYNQAACAFVLLLAFYLFLRHVETSDQRFWAAQWIVFLLGFGVLEINVMYPALALSYAVLFARPYIRKTLWLFLPSILFFVAHRVATRDIAVAAYSMHLDTSLFNTLWIYSYWVLNTTPSSALPPGGAVIAFSLLALGIAAFTIYQAVRGNWLPAFCLAWFFLMLAPVLPLRDHITLYYLTVPSIGIAMAGAIALAQAWRSHWAMRAAAFVLIGFYGYAGVASIRPSVAQSVERSRKIEQLVGSVAHARQVNPGKVILITDLDEETFWQGMIDDPFRLIGVREVYLAPEMESRIRPRPELGRVTDYVLPAAATRRVLEQGRAAVYSAGPVYRNVTRIYEARIASMPADLPRRVDCGNRAFEDFLGPGWYKADSGVRWMPAEASVRLAGPKPGDRLYLTGYRGDESMADFPVRLTVSANGSRLGEQTIAAGETQFTVELKIPAPLLNAASLSVSLAVDRTFQPPADGRVLGLAFGVVELR